MHMLLLLDMQTDVWALHGQLAMYVSKQHILLICQCLFYVYVSVSKDTNEIL